MSFHCVCVYCTRNAKGGENTKARMFVHQLAEFFFYYFLFFTHLFIYLFLMVQTRCAAFEILIETYNEHIVFWVCIN